LPGSFVVLLLDYLDLINLILLHLLVMSIGDGWFSNNSTAARHCHLLETGIYGRPAFIRDPLTQYCICYNMGIRTPGVYFSEHLLLVLRYYLLFVCCYVYTCVEL